MWELILQELISWHHAKHTYIYLSKRHMKAKGSFTITSGCKMVNESVRDKESSGYKSVDYEFRKLSGLEMFVYMT